jgi:hypothetical protein
MKDFLKPYFVYFLEAFSMDTLTIPLTKKMKEQMTRFPQMPWDKIARDALKRALEDFDVLAELTAESELTEEDAANLADQVNLQMAKRYGVIQ